MQTRSLRTRSLLPEDRDAELEAAHRRARAAMAEVNRLARKARIRAGIEHAWRSHEAPLPHHAIDWALTGVTVAAAAGLVIWLWHSSKAEARQSESGLNLLGAVAV